MKKLLLVFVLIAALFTGCGPSEPPAVIQPLPDTTMDNLDNCIVAISMDEGDAYLDDTGRLQMIFQPYTYDKYDMVDIAALKKGDTIVTHDGEVEVTSVEQTDSGVVLVNGGLEDGGFDLVTDDSGVFYEVGYNDAKNWYSLGEVQYRISTEFEFRDNIDPDKGEVMHYPGSFLIGEVTDYNFTPYNTTIRIEDSQIVEMDRIFTP